MLWARSRSSLGQQHARPPDAQGSAEAVSTIICIGAAEGNLGSYSW